MGLLITSAASVNALGTACAEMVLGSVLSEDVVGSAFSELMGDSATGCRAAFPGVKIDATNETGLVTDEMLGNGGFCVILRSEGEA